MPLTRRTLLKGGAGVLVVAQLGMAESALAGGRRKLASHLRRSTYAPLVGSNFEMRSADGARSVVQLVEIRDLVWPERPDADVKERAFMLIFRGSAIGGLAAETCRVRHRDAGRFDLWISSVSSSLLASDYAVVVNNAKVGDPREKRMQRRQRKAMRRRRSHDETRDRSRKPERKPRRSRDSEPERERERRPRRPEPRDTAPDAAPAAPSVPVEPLQRGE